MNTSVVKYRDLALNVVFYTKKRQLGNKIFFATSKFQDVIDYFEKNLKDPQTFLKSSYFVNGKQIYPSDILLYYCTVDPNLHLIEEDMFVEIDELEHLDDASDPIYENLLTPIIDPFRLILLSIKEGVMKQIDFSQEKIKEFGFDNINNNYACCNSLDALYISCGKDFWIIANDTFHIERKEMPFFKEKHSMAYILSNNIIFIAGGDEQSFYYDINNKEFITWGKMNGPCEKPGLIQYGDFLYSFNSYNQAGLYFERTKLKNPAKKWEKLLPQSGDHESGFFYNKLYGVSKCSDGNILFAGGIDNQLRTFEYNVKLNVLYINSSKDESIMLNERNFYKIDHNFSVAIPNDLLKDHVIAIVNKNSKSLNLCQFEQISGRNNILKTDNPRDRLAGNVIIQCKYMTKKEYEIYSKQKEIEKNNNINNEQKNITKKLGDKINPNPYRYQYRGKTPALERISEGKSEDESDEEEIVKNRANSAEKNKRTLDLDLKLDNIEKYNISSQKLEDDESEEEEKKNENEINENHNEEEVEISNKKEDKNINNLENNNLNINDNNNPEKDNIIKDDLNDGVKQDEINIKENNIAENDLEKKYIKIIEQNNNPIIKEENKILEIKLEKVYVENKEPNIKKDSNINEEKNDLIMNLGDRETNIDIDNGIENINNINAAETKEINNNNQIIKDQINNQNIIERYPENEIEENKNLQEENEIKKDKNETKNINNLIEESKNEDIQYKENICENGKENINQNKSIFKKLQLDIKEGDKSNEFNNNNNYILSSNSKSKENNNKNNKDKQPIVNIINEQNVNPFINNKSNLNNKKGSNNLIINKTKNNEINKDNNININKNKNINANNNFNQNINNNINNKEGNKMQKDKNNDDKNLKINLNQIINENNCNSNSSNNVKEKEFYRKINRNKKENLSYNKMNKERNQEVHINNNNMNSKNYNNKVNASQKKNIKNNIINSKENSAINEKINNNNAKEKMQKKENKKSKINKNIADSKNGRQKSNENLLIHKSSTNFTLSNNNSNNNSNIQTLNHHILSSNPFTYHNKVNNTGDFEVCYINEDLSNANKISENRSTKMLKDMKKKKKKNINYKTKTAKSLQTSSKEMQSQTNPFNNKNETSRNNNNKKSSKSINASSYKTSTYNKSKIKQFVTLNNNVNNGQGAICSTKSEKKFSKKNNSTKISISPDIKVSPKKILNNSHYDAKKIQNYTEMYIKHNKIQNNHNQRINTTNNININYYKILNNNVRMLKLDQSLTSRLNNSNEKLMKQENNSGNKNLFFTRDGKRYVLSKNVQRVRRENGKIKAEEKKDFYTNADDKLSKTTNQ